MKTSVQVIRVSAARSRESVPSLSSWLDSVQVRPLTHAASLIHTCDDDTPIPHDGATAELPDLVTFKLL